MAGVVLLSRSTPQCGAMYGHAWKCPEQVIASIIDHSHCGMSDVAFRTVPPFGGPSCFFFYVNCNFSVVPHVLRGATCVLIWMYLYSAEGDIANSRVREIDDWDQIISPAIIGNWYKELVNRGNIFNQSNNNLIHLAHINLVTRIWGAC